MFQSTLDLLDQYHQKMVRDNVPEFNGDLALEVKKRLQQLDFLYANIEDKQIRYNDLHLKMMGDGSLEKRIKAAGGYLTIVGCEELSEMRHLMFEIEMYTESFYYLAGRMYTILKKGFLPGLESFKCIGARDVRNKLLEHADGKQSQIYIQSFGIGGDQGPTLKIERPQGQEMIFPDAGLYANTEEIRSNLEKLLTASL